MPGGGLPGDIQLDSPTFNGNADAVVMSNLSVTSPAAKARDS
jgi:hypothetical protein